MSQLISWAVPDKYDVKLQPDVRSVIIQKQTGGVGNFVQIAQINVTSDGNAKSQANHWIDRYEDLVGTVDDFYQIAFCTLDQKIGQYSQPGQGGYLDRFHEIMDNMRYTLGDDNPYFYELDQIGMFKWNGTQLARFMNESLSDFNGTGPMVSKFNWQNVPDDALPCIRECVKFLALDSRSTKEVANKVKISDSVSADTNDRAGDYKSRADSAYTRFIEKTKAWKLSHRPRALGLDTCKLPFRILRPLSLLPNMSTVFGL